MFTEKIYTLKEVSEHLRVTEDALEKEIAAGRLPAGRIQGFVRVRETDLAFYKNEAFTCVADTNQVRQGNDSKLNTVPDFTFTWPDNKVEQFTEAREGVISHGGKEYRVKLGFTVRSSSGKRRRRCLILVDRYASVEFVAADEKSNGRMASIIKDRDGKQLPVGATLPPEYNGVPVGPYRDVVQGIGASNGLAVVCDESDIEAMVKHALIRYLFRKDRA